MGRLFEDLVFSPPRWQNSSKPSQAKWSGCRWPVDFRVTSHDEWYCLEVNPSPAFVYCQDLTGVDIAASVSRLLASAQLG
jgi:hypothetical protein